MGCLSIPYCNVFIHMKVMTVISKILIKIRKKVCELVDAAVDLDMYVIVDWHVLGDCNPQT